MHYFSAFEAAVVYFRKESSEILVVGKTLRAPANFLRARLRADGGSKILAPIRASKRRLLVRTTKISGSFLRQRVFVSGR